MGCSTYDFIERVRWYLVILLHIKVSRKKHSFILTFFLFTDVDNDVIKVRNTDFRNLYRIHDLHLSSMRKIYLKRKHFCSKTLAYYGSLLVFTCQCFQLLLNLVVDLCYHDMKNDIRTKNKSRCPYKKSTLKVARASGFLL